MLHRAPWPAQLQACKPPERGSTPTPQLSKLSPLGHSGSGLLLCGLRHFLSPLPSSLDFSEHEV